MRAVTRQETTAVVVDPELYDKQLNRVDPSDSHAAICREVSDIPGCATIAEHSRRTWWRTPKFSMSVLLHPLAVCQ